MKLKDIIIHNLFDRYDYHLQFGEDSRYLILTSPNGYGKTTILNIINALATSDLFYFYWLPYREISLMFDDSAKLSVMSVDVVPEVEDVPADKTHEVTFRWIDTTGNESQFAINERLIQKATRSIGYYEGRRISSDNILTREFREFVNRNPRMLQLIAREQGNNAFLLQIKSFNTVFIEAQRIYSSKPSYDGHSAIVRSDMLSTLPTFSIDEVASKISDIIKEARVGYLEYTQEKNNQLIYRLLSNKYVELSSEQYQSLRTELLGKIQELKQYGLIDEADIPEYDQAHSRELSAHIAEIQDKLSKLDEVYGKVKLFSELLSNKHFTAKTVSFSREKGLRAKDSGDKWLELSGLSSGEQNIIIMLYYLVFEYNNNKLLLVDEPEISLHVAWQYQYIEELEKILELNDGQAIIATHSPQIIGERWDRCIDLTE